LPSKIDQDLSYKNQLLNKMHNKAFSLHLVKFVIIGASNTIISYIVFFILYNTVLAGDAFHSQCFSYSAGIIWSFIWNKRWTFSEKPNRWASFAPFLILQLTLLLISAFALDIAKGNLDWNINLIWVCVMTVSTIINFAITKYLVFRA
jgi:putative flippase GtrA